MLITIPTCGESPHLENLVKQCLAGGADVAVVANNTTPEQREYVESQVPSPAVVVDGGNGVRSLYTTWNACLEMCVASDQPTGAILNDDIDIDPSSIALIEASILAGHGVVGWEAFAEPSPAPQSSLREVHGSYKTHGLAGFAFAFDPNKVPVFDDEYTWWYGDDHWIQSCKKEGVRLWVESQCGVKHHTSTSQIARPWVMRDVTQDRGRFERLWGTA